MSNSIISVGISAPLLSLMLYDSCAVKSRAGYFTGRRYTLQNKKYHIEIESVVPYSENGILYSGYEEHMSKISFKKIVGWFFFKVGNKDDNLDVKLSIKDKQIVESMQAKLQTKLAMLYCIMVNNYMYDQKQKRTVHSYHFQFYEKGNSDIFYKVMCENPVQKYNDFNPYWKGNINNDWRKFFKNNTFSVPYDINSKEFKKTINEIIIREKILFQLMHEIYSIYENMQTLQTQIQEENKLSDGEEEARLRINIIKKNKARLYRDRYIKLYYLNYVNGD